MEPDHRRQFTNSQAMPVLSSISLKRGAVLVPAFAVAVPLSANGKKYWYISRLLCHSAVLRDYFCQAPGTYGCWGLNPG